jgi:hypothetical protein
MNRPRLTIVPRGGNRPCAITDVVLTELDDELLVYDQARHRAHCLNRTAGFIWRHCDGTNDVADLAQLTEEAFGSPADESFVWLALKQLLRARLLEPGLEPPDDVERSTRRQLLLRIGRTSAVALLAPVVASITAPLAVAAASCSGTGGTCVVDGDCCGGCTCSSGSCVGTC